ncbi:hypothetical protein Tco_0216623 [Tanacetum coccineum]
MLPSIGRVSSTNASGSKAKSNIKNDRIQRTSSRSKKNKVEACHRKFKSSANKNNRVSDCNVNVKNVALSKNSDTICISCNECLFSANHDACVVKYLKDENSAPSSYATSTIVVSPGHILTTTVIPVDEPCPKLSRRYANARKCLSRSYLNSDIHPFNLHDYGGYVFGMEILNTMISDAIKKSAGYNYYIAKKKEMNAPNKLKKDVMPRKTRSLTIAEEIVVDIYAEWGQKLKDPTVEDPTVQSLLDLRKGSKASRLKNLKQKKQAIAKEGLSNAHNKHFADSNSDSYTVLYSSCSEESENETDDADDSDIDLSDDNPQGDNDVVKFGMFMYNKSIETPNSTYFSPMVISSLLDFIQNLLNETPANELTDFCTSEVPLAFEKAVQARVLTEIKKLLPTHIPKAHANYVKPRLNTSVIEDALNALDEEPSFHKRAHDNQDPPNNREGEKQEETSKGCRRTFFKIIKAKQISHDIDENENHILGPSTIAIAKKIKAIIQKDELTIADLEGARQERLKQQYQNDVELEYYVDQLKAAVLSEAKWNSDEDDVLSTEEKYTTSITKHYAARYYKQGIEDMISDRWSKETHRYIFEALNDLRVKSVVRIVVKKKQGYGFLTSIVVKRFDDQEYEFSYADRPRLSLNDVEDLYLLQVQDKLHHLLLEFVKDFNNALLLFIRRVVIQNRVEDIQLGVESY